MDLTSLNLIDHLIYGDGYFTSILDASTLLGRANVDVPSVGSENAPVLTPSCFQSTCNHNNFYATIPQWNSSWIDSIPHQSMNLMGSPQQDIDPAVPFDDFNLDPLTCDVDLTVPCNNNNINENISQDGYGRDNGGLLGDVCNAIKPTTQTTTSMLQCGGANAAEDRLDVISINNIDGGGVAISGIAGGVAKKHRSNSIGYEEIARCFCMNIADAAKELNVGLTVLKKRCRELGISRWPHRKMKSLQLLIRNVQEVGKGGMDEGLRKEMDELMEQQRQMEMMPQLELSDRTKRLRQACFKANYKKRRALGNHIWFPAKRTRSLADRSFC